MRQHDFVGPQLVSVSTANNDVGELFRVHHLLQAGHQPVFVVVVLDVCHLETIESQSLFVKRTQRYVHPRTVNVIIIIIITRIMVFLFFFYIFPKRTMFSVYRYHHCAVKYHSI